MERVATDDADMVEAVPDVHLSVLAGAERMNVQHFRIEPGATVPSHSHEQEQVGYLTAGELTFVLEGGEEVVVRAGESYALDAGEVHAAENRGGETVEGVDIFSPPRTMADWGDE